ncbi:MAG: hypothetical protein OXG13_02875 [Gemmatimonadaceae bacterium]|nr:hypothetical protein [Gemmatimonadaceae bacterium]
MVKRPVRDSVRRVLEHLSDNLPAQSRIRASLDLDQSRHSILIEEEVVERPPVTTIVLAGNPCLPRDQQPPAGCGWVDVIAAQQVREAGEKILQLILRGVLLLIKRLEVAIGNQEHLAHGAASFPVSQGDQDRCCVRSAPENPGHAEPARLTVT